ncbi:hypothetical protein D3C81_1008520 [compost metagenome]
MGLAMTPVPDPAGTVAWTKLVPEQALRAHPQLSEIGAGGHRLFGAETLSRGQ